jgi:hypothetical protein
MNIARSIRSIDYMPNISSVSYLSSKLFSRCEMLRIIILSILTSTITFAIDYRDAQNPNIESQLGIVKLLVRYHTMCLKKIHPQTHHIHVMTFQDGAPSMITCTKWNKEKKTGGENQTLSIRDWLLVASDIPVKESVAGERGNVPSLL